MVSKTNVILHGYYGRGNLGDEALLSAISAQISSIPGSRIIVFSKDADNTRATHDIASVNPWKWFRIPGYWRLLTAKAYILGGGGLIKDYGNSSKDMERWLHYLPVAKRLGLKTMLWSVGVDNIRFEKSRQLVRKVLSSVDVITVRDPQSMRDLEDIGVQNRIVITGDPAVLLTQNKRRVRLLRHPPTVVVCMRHWYRDGYFVPDVSANQNMETSVAASLDYLVSKWGAQIHFLPFRVTQPDDDRQAAVAIVERMHRQETVTFHQHPATHKEAIDVLSTADLVVGMRLHSLILATALGIPCIALSYLPKVRRYMDQVQQGTFCWEIEDVERNVLCEAMDYIFQNYGQVSTDLVAVADSTTRQLDENVRLLSQLLSYRSH